VKEKLWRLNRLLTLVLKKKKNLKEIGDLYSAYSALPGGSRHWEQTVLPG
jgi:hypothetical protein